MKLTAKERTYEKKSEIKRIRREGDIPANLYSKDRPNRPIFISGTDFSTIMRGMEVGHLPTTVFTLNFDGKEIQAVVKDIQYHPTTYIVTHLDFVELLKDQPVTVKVPVKCVGVTECAGLKLGGFLRQVMRHVTVECLPKDMPKAFVVDVAPLGIKQSKKLKDLDVPPGVKLVVKGLEPKRKGVILDKKAKPRTKLDEVVVVIAKRQG